MSEIQVLDRGVLFDGEALRAMWFRIRDREGRIRYRAVCLRELAYLPIEAREDPDILGKQWAALRGLYNAGVDFSYTAMGVYHPRRVGVVQFYGAAAEGDLQDEAVGEALRRMAAVEAVLANYPQSRLRAPDTERVQWLMERLERLPRVLAILGHPDPRLARKGLGRDGSMGEADDELMSQQGETFLRGLAALEEDFVFAVMAAHVGRGDLARGLVKMAQAASLFASRQRGSIGASFSIAIPLVAALAGNYGGTQGRGDSRGRSTAEGHSEAWGEYQARSTAYTRSHSVTESEAQTRSVAVTDSQAYTRSYAETESTASTSTWARTTGGAETYSVAETTGETRTEGGARASSYVRSTAETSGTSWGRATTEGEAVTRGRAWGQSTAKTTGQSTSVNVSLGQNWNQGTGVNVSWPAVTRTEQESSGRSYPNPDNPPVTVSREGMTVSRGETNYGSFEQAYRAILAYGSEQGVAAARMADAIGAPMEQVAGATPPQYGTVSMGPGQESTTVSGGGNVGLKGILGLGGQHSQGRTTPAGPTVSAQYGTVVQQGVSGPAPGPAGNSVSVQAGGETLSEGRSEAVTRPVTPGLGVTGSASRGGSLGVGVGSVTTETTTEGRFESQSEAVTTSRSSTTSRGGFQSTTRGEAWGTTDIRSWATSRSTARTEGTAKTTSWASTVGGATTQGRAVTEGWAVTQGRAVTRGEAWTTARAETRGEAWTEGETRGTSRQVSRSSMEGEAVAYSLARSGSRGFVGGFGGSIVPGFAVTRSWQTEDDVAIRLTELARMLESLLNQASAEGGFLTTAVLLTTDTGAKAAAALVPQAFHGPNVPTPVLTVDAPDELRLHALTLRPSLEPDGDPFGAGLWTKWGTLLTPGMLAAYTAPNLFEEGTAVTVQERIPPMAFYPETEGDVVIGHQVSPETGRLTTTPLRLSRRRHFHTAFIGDTGYGKSVAAERIAYETTLRWRMKTIILDFGAGWRKMLNAPGLEGHVDIRQLSPGGPRPLRWNPLQIGRNILPEVQWRAFADIFGNVAKLGERRQIHELRDALRRVYLAAGVLVDDPDVQDDSTWGRVRDAEEARVTGAPVGTALRNLDREARQRLAVHRSRFVGLQDLYDHIEAEIENIPPRDIRRSILEGILYRLHPLVQGAAARQYAAGEDAVDINEIVPGDWGIVVLEGGANLDEFSKAFLLAWAAYHFYTDAVARRIRRARSHGWEVQIFFEEANKMLAGLDGRGEEGGPSTAEQFEAMWRDSRKYGIALHVITQSPSQVPQGILSSCNNIVVSQTKNPKDRDLAVAMIHRSEKGFVDEAWRRFIGSIPVARAVVKLGYSFDRARVEPVYVQPLLLDATEPTDEEIAAQLGEIRP